MIAVSFSISCFIFLLILTIFYLSKPRLHTVDNQLFTSLMFINIVGIFIDIAGFASFNLFGTDSYINVVVSKVYLVYYITYVFCFMLYIYNVSAKKSRIVPSILTSVFVGGIGFIFILPIYLHFKDGVGYSYGPSVNAAYAIGSLFIVFMLFCLIKNIKKIGYKRYIPLIALLILTIITVVIQKIRPDITILLLSNTIVTYLMYFTIENPDVQMMEELYKNRKIIEKSNEDHSNFIFKMTQDVKRPIKEIIDITSDTNDEKLKEINNLGKNLDYLIDDALDVSQMTTKKLKLYNTRYNPKNLFNEIKYRAESKLNSNTKLEYHISSNTPEYVYGDSIKIKQILSSILDNSIDHTKKGYITIEINTIIKYGICRFIIDVTDNGEGISIDKVNEILSFKDTDETFDPDSEKLTLREIKLLTNKIGGSFMIKSNEESGSTVSVTIDQKIVETKEREISKKLDLYEESLHKNKKIIVIDDDAKELSQITSYLEEKELSVSGSLFGRDVIEKIGSSHKFDLIILDDETNTYSAYDTLKELKKHEKFNTPVVIMIDDNKEFIKLHYLQDGFADVIMKSKLKSELDRILKRF